MLRLHVPNALLGMPDIRDKTHPLRDSSDYARYMWGKIPFHGGAKFLYLCFRPCTRKLAAIFAVACFPGQYQMLAVEHILAVPVVASGLEMLLLHLSEAELRSMVEVQDFAVEEPNSCENV